MSGLQLGDKRSMNNVDLENEGIWAEIDAGLQDTVGFYAEKPETTESMEEDRPICLIKIRRYGAPRIKQHQRAISRRYNLQKGSQVEKMTTEVMSELIVVDWDKVADEDGEPMECIPENVRKFLEDPRYKWLRELIEVVAGNGRLFRDDSLEDLGKQSSLSSESGSATSSGGRTKKKT